MNSPETNVWIRHLAWDLFRDAADEDYILARIGMRYRLHRQYYWHAQQAVEKYLKCFHLLNVGPVVDFGHSIEDLLGAVSEAAGNLLPAVFVPPSYFPESDNIYSRKFEPYADFLGRLNQNGSPDVRYRTYSITPDNFDLHKLDEFCFHIRRICMPLQLVAIGFDKPYGQVLREHRDYQPRPDFKCLKPLGQYDIEPIKKNLMWRNFSFFEEEALADGKISVGRSAHNAAISMTLQRLPDPESKAAIEWLMENVKLQKSDKQTIREILDRGKI